MITVTFQPVASELQDSVEPDLKWQASIGGDGKYIGLGANPFDAFVALYSSLHPNGGPSELTDWNPQNFSDGFNTMEDLYTWQYTFLAVISRLGNWGNGDRKICGWKCWNMPGGGMLMDKFFVGMELRPGKSCFFVVPGLWWSQIGFPQHEECPPLPELTNNESFALLEEWLKTDTYQIDQEMRDRLAR